MASRRTRSLSLHQVRSSYLLSDLLWLPKKPANTALPLPSMPPHPPSSLEGVGVSVSGDLRAPL